MSGCAGIFKKAITRILVPWAVGSLTVDYAVKMTHLRGIRTTGTPEALLDYFGLLEREVVVRRRRQSLTD